jgi:spore coat protein H
MKKMMLFLPILLLLWNCSDLDTSNITTITDAAKASIPLPQSDVVFDMNQVPVITLEFTVAEWNKLLTNYDLNPKNEKKVVTKFTFDGPGRATIIDSVGLKLKGNTSRRRPEGDTGQLHDGMNPDWHHFHMSLDFSKYRDNQRFKGLNKLNLKWFKDDKSYAREIYSYNLFRRFGCWQAPLASYCRVNIKIAGEDAAYYGVYVLLESVDEDYIAKRAASWSPSVGFLWKAGYGEGGNADFVQTVGMGVEDVNINPALSVYYAYDLKTRKDELPAAKTELTQFITDLNTKTGTAFQTWIAQKMDVPLFLKTYATNVMLGMWDDYWVNGNNFYFYFAGNGKAYFIPYDYDNTLGTSSLIDNSGTQNPLTWGGTSGRPLITKILAIPAYQTMYKNYITELINANNDYFAANKSIARIQGWQTKIAGFVSNDTGEDMIIQDRPASWGNQPNYRLLTGNNLGGTNGSANYFSSRAASIPW